MKKKRISEMYLLERQQWLYEVLQKHQNSMIYSFIFIHSVKSEIDKNVHSMHCGFHTKRGRWDTLSFFNRGDVEVFESVKSLGREVHIFQVPWDNRTFKNIRTFCLYSCCSSCKISRTICTMLLLQIFEKL